MKRRRRGGAAQQPEACDVWLDTAQLKQSPAQPLIAKPKVPSQVLEWRQGSGLFTQPRASQPRTKQTTISAFFSRQPDEKDKENSRPSPVILNKDCKGKAVALDASPVKILALPQGEAQKGSLGAEEQGPAQRCAPRAPTAPLGDSSLSQAESQERNSASCRMGEDSCPFSFTQDSTGNRIIAHRSARNQEEKPHQSSGVHSLIDFTAPEDINPAAVRDLPRPPGFSSSPQGPTGAQPLREHNGNAGSGSGGQGRGSPCGQFHGSPCGQFHGSPCGQLHGSPCGQLHGSPCRQFHGSPCRQFHGSPCRQLHGSPCRQFHHSPCRQLHGSPCRQLQGSPCRQLHGSPCGQFHGSPCRQLQGSPCRQLHGSPCRQFHGSPCRQFHHSPCRQLHGSPCRQFHGSPCRQFHHSPCRQLHGNPCRQLHGSPCRQLHGSPCGQFHGSPCRQFHGSPCRQFHGSPCRQLFTQDSEGNRVIAHPWHSLPSPGKAWSSSSQQPPRSPSVGCSGSLSKAGEQEAEVGYEFLFTQDSEGNRVIKHW